VTDDVDVFWHRFGGDTRGPGGDLVGYRHHVPPPISRWERSGASPDRPRSCRECREGKHANCDGTTWDEALDGYAPCPCAASGHP